MSSWGKIFVIHTKIKSEPAGVEREFWVEGGGGGRDSYLRVAQLMETCLQSVFPLQIGTYMLTSKTITPEIPAMPQSRTCK